MLNKSEGRFLIWTKGKIYFQQTCAIVEGDIRKLRHDPYELLTRMIQPTIWLLIFGQAMAHAKAMPISEQSYLDYLAPGILAQSVLFMSIFYGIALIWERDMGILHKILIAPAPRVCLVIGRSIAAGNALRSLMIAGETSHFGLGIDFFVVFCTYLIFLAIATPLYPKILY